MIQDGIGKELRSLNNKICRYFEFSSHKKEVDSATGNNGWIIIYLAHHEHRDVYQKDIEDSFTITRSTASKVLGLMEQKGLIERQSVAQDARLKKIVLTEKSREIRNAIMEDIQNLERTLTVGFSAEEVDTLRSMLLRMKENISDSKEKSGGNINA